MYLGNQPPGTMRVASVFGDDWIITYDFKDGVQQVCLMIDMFYTVININTISDVDNQWQIIH